MKAERAKEILHQSNQFPYWGNSQRFMTPEEIAEVKALWDTMPGHTCFNDALRRIAKKGA